MNCIICNKPTATVQRTGSYKYKGVYIVYLYEEQKCNDHPNDTFQTSDQIQAALDKIKARKEEIDKA